MPDSTANQRTQNATRRRIGLVSPERGSFQKLGLQTDGGGQSAGIWGAGIPEPLDGTPRPLAVSLVASAAASIQDSNLCPRGVATL